MKLTTNVSLQCPHVTRILLSPTGIAVGTAFDAATGGPPPTFITRLL